MPVQRIFWFFLLFLLQALPGLSSPIHVSETEYRSFRSLTLDSGLEVLLVHDERTTKAAAAIALPVGNLDDPDAQLGLAHYLEHMLFLGSAAYPEPAGLQGFVQRNGGSTNAATGYASTIYVLEVDAPAFGEGLQRMADALASPLLDPVYADKERNAVHAEMESKKYEDGRRLAMLTLGTMNPDHPVVRFSGGNLETLSDKPESILHEELVRFHQTWYCASLMKAVLYGPQSLDELEQIAQHTLALIPHGDASIAVPLVPAVTEAEQGVMIGMRPVRQARSITVEFILPQDLDQYETKPVQVVASVLGTETKDSLVDVLRSQGLVLGLSVGADTSTLRNGIIFSLSMELTPKGEAHRNKVLSTVFAYLDLLRETGISQEYYDQYKRIMDMQFQHAPVQSGFGYVYQAAAHMLQYPVEDVHFGPYRLDYFDQRTASRVLDLLTAERARIFHVGADQPVDQEAYFYQTSYSMRVLSQGDFTTWAREDHQLYLPQLNPFVPDDFSVIANQGNAAPQKFVEYPGLTAWHGFSQFHEQPKAILMTRLQSAAFAATLEQAALQGLLLEFLSQTQAGLRYQAAEAGLGLSISGDEGLVVTISGFSQHQGDLLFMALEFLDQAVDAGAFAQAKAEYLRKLANQEKQSVFRQAMSMMGNLLRPLSWDYLAMEHAAQKISRDDLANYLHTVRQDLRFTIFGFGNITQESLKNVAFGLEKYVGPQAGAPMVAMRILPKKDLVVSYQRETVLEDSALLELFLAPEATPSMKAQVLILEGLLDPRFFSRLRTEEQLGYVASTMPVMFGRAVGIGFGVQSPVQGPAWLAGRFDSFYFWGLNQIRSVSTEEFESVRQGLLSTMTQSPDTLRAEFLELETDLRLGNVHFDSQKQLIDALQQVTLPQVVRTYETLVLGRLGTQVIIQVQGTRHAHLEWAENTLAVPITAPQDFHQLVDVQRYRGL